MTEKLEDRFKTLGPYDQKELIRDLKTLVEDLNARIASIDSDKASLQDQIDAINARLTAAGIP